MLCHHTFTHIADMLWLDSKKIFLLFKLQTMALWEKNGSSKEQDAVSQHALGRVQQGMHT